jgi:ribosomal protein L34E
VKEARENKRQQTTQVHADAKQIVGGVNTTQPTHMIKSKHHKHDNKTHYKPFPARSSQWVAIADRTLEPVNSESWRFGRRL